MSASPLLLLFLFHLTIPSLSDPRATQAALICSDPMASISQRKTHTSNFLDALDDLNPSIATQRFGFSIKNTKNSTVYAFADCMKDLSGPDCAVCFAQSKTHVVMCLGSRRGRVFFDGCYLRYDYYNFSSEILSVEDKTVCGNGSYSGGNQSVFEDNVMGLVRNLSVEAPRNDGFYVGRSNNNVSVYGLAQCWEFVNKSDCERCLKEAVNRIASCKTKEEGRVLNAGCYLRYSTQSFYGNSSSNAPPLQSQGER